MERYKVDLLYGMSSKLDGSHSHLKTVIEAPNLRSAKVKATQWMQSFGVSIKNRWFQQERWCRELKKRVKVNAYSKKDSRYIFRCTKSLEITLIEGE